MIVFGGLFAASLVAGLVALAGHYHLSRSYTAPTQTAFCAVSALAFVLGSLVYALTSGLWQHAFAGGAVALATWIATKVLDHHWDAQSRHDEAVWRLALAHHNEEADVGDDAGTEGVRG